MLCIYMLSCHTPYIYIYICLMDIIVSINIHTPSTWSTWFGSSNVAFSGRSVTRGKCLRVCGLRTWGWTSHPTSSTHTTALESSTDPTTRTVSSSWPLLMRTNTVAVLADLAIEKCHFFWRRHYIENGSRSARKNVTRKASLAQYICFVSWNC